MVVSLENETSELRGGDDNGGDPAELEINNGAELVSEVSESVVWHVCKKMMKVTYNGKF